MKIANEYEKKSVNARVSAMCWMLCHNTSMTRMMQVNSMEEKEGKKSHDNRTTNFDVEVCKVQDACRGTRTFKQKKSLEMLQKGGKHKKTIVLQLASSQVSYTH